MPEATGIEFNPSECSFRWMKDLHREEFDLRASPTLDGTVARGRLSVYFGVILLAEVDFAFKVDSSQPIEASSELHEQTTVRPYDKVFPSYSHQDTQIVEQVEALVESLGIRYLRDVRTLKSGENWDERLLELIGEADVFQLFWSSNSMRSPNVQREWEYALTLGRANFIRPTYWEDPLPESPDHSLPPQTLRALTFQSDSGWSCPKRTACSRRDLDHRSASPEPGTRSQPA